MPRKPSTTSIYSIARELQISPSTVSRVINNRTGVSEDTRNTVNALLRKYNFKINYPLQRKSKIAIVSRDTLISHYTALVIGGIREYIYEHNLMVCSIFHDNRDDESLLAIIRDNQCSGVILINADEFETDLEELNNCDLPVMLVDKSTQLPNIGYVDNDSYNGAFMATKYLLDLGHRKIGCIVRKDGLNHRQRYIGYCDAMAEAGVSLQPTWTIELSKDNILATDMHHGEMLFSRLLENAPDLSAVMTTNDNYAMGALAAAHKMGLNVPEEISIVGFDNYDFSEFTIPSLTTVHHPAKEAGWQAAKAINDYITSNGTTPLIKKTLPTKLIIRNSTK